MPVWTTTQEYVLRNWPLLVPPLVVMIAALAIGWAVRRLLFRALAARAAVTETPLDDALLGALRGPSLAWILMLAIHLAAQVSPLTPRRATVIGQALLLLWIASATVVAARLAALSVRWYGRQMAPSHPVTTLTQNLVALLVTLLGGLILLNTLGVSITPVLTALGVGGIAVALALQDTLSNLFAGFYISLARQVRPGDYVRLDSGQEGYVTDITWRSTTLRALQNNLVVVPNAKLAQAIVTNFHLPETRMALPIPVGVSYESDPDHVERILLEEAGGAVGSTPGLLGEPPPVVRFIPGFGDSSLNFTLVCQVAEFSDQFAVQHELRKRILKRFRAEGIEIPFPIRTVYLKGGESG